ncbi:MAG: DUF1565 domain-containing protein, partial [Bacteroidota bacterium]
NDANGNRQVFRMSNAITSSGYTSQVFSATSTQVAGETNAALWNNRGTVGSSPFNPIQYGAYSANNTFYTKLKFRSATGAAQPGLALTLSPSAKQSAVRMGYIQIQDNGTTGFNLNFYETLANGAFPSTPTVIASGLSYSALHTLEMGITFVDGVSTVGGQVYGNDVVKVWLNGNLIHTGTTWESYYYTTAAERNAVATAPAPRLQAVNSMLFRVAGTAATATSGNGFYFEDFAISNTIPSATLFGPTSVVGCSATASVTIAQPAAPVALSTSQVNVSCNGGSNASIDLSVTGGTAPYTYAWSNGATSQDLNNITAGTYTVIVTDANGMTSGCTATTSVTITQPAVLVVTPSSNSPIYVGATLNITSSVSGGTAGFTYSWSGPNSFASTDANPSIAGATIAANGVYTVVTTDANGCTATATVTATIYGTELYVNDNSTSGDVYTTAVGSDTNPGTASAPFATITKAIQVAQTGNTIKVDAGSYSENLTVNGKNLVFL